MHALVGLPHLTLEAIQYQIWFPWKHYLSFLLMTTLKKKKIMTTLEEILRRTACLSPCKEYPSTATEPYDSRINEFSPVMDYQIFLYLFNKGNVNSAVKTGLSLWICCLCSFANLVYFAFWSQDAGINMFLDARRHLIQYPLISVIFLKASQYP